MLNRNRPDGVLVSMFSVNDRKAMPMPCRLFVPERPFQLCAADDRALPKRFLMPRYISAPLFPRPAPKLSLTLRIRDVRRFRMSPSALTLISEGDYPKFQQMIAELRQTEHTESLEDRAKSIAYRRSRNGSSVTRRV
jgi:hypothetical protein